MALVALVARATQVDQITPVVWVTQVAQMQVVSMDLLVEKPRKRLADRVEESV